MSFFLTIKILRVFGNPLHILLVLTWLGGLLALTNVERVKKVGQIVSLLAVTVTLMIGLLPIGDYWLQAIEHQVPRAALPAQVDGIIVLGGMIRSAIYNSYHEPVLSEHPDRLRCFVALSRRYPKAKLLFTGGSSQLLGQTTSEATAFAQLWAAMGGDPQRLQLETQSRNTAENAYDSYQLIRPAAGAQWVLLTSAYHMPRAYAEFQRVGWPVLPYACDYQTANPPLANYQLDIAINWLHFESAWKEWVGGLVYRWHD